MTSESPTAAVLKIQMRGVYKAFDATTVLDGINLDVATGNVIALIGASGSGKSTLLRCVNLLEPVDDGEIFFDGVDIAEPGLDPDPIRRRIGMVFQSFNLFPHMSVTDNVAIGPRKVLGTDKATARQQGRALLDRLDLGDRADSYPDHLSGGQQQRVALARALITRPQVLLLDEPLSALDPFLRIRMRSELRKLQKELGISFLHVTHAQEEALALADEIIVMNDAVIEQAGPAREVFNAPKTKFVAQFIGGHNVFVLPEGTVAVRTDAVSTSDVKNGRIEASVLAIEYQGTHVAILTKIAGDHEVIALVPDAKFFAKPHNPGDQIGLIWDQSNQHQLTA